MRYYYFHCPSEQYGLIERYALYYESMLMDHKKLPILDMIKAVDAHSNHQCHM